MNQQPHAHLSRPVHKEPPAHAPNAALLIDFDNVTMGIRSDLQTELKRLLQSEIIRGKVAVQRAYADWRRYPQYIVPLSESSIDLIFAPAYGSNKKNATDIRLAIDALELVFTRPEIGTFILLSGDSDFSSLVLKLKEYGKYVIGVGIRESSSDLLIQNCDEYYSYNELAGFTKASDVTHERRDPWELVVEAVKQMTAHNDVMRSDRLKQVMQEIDPNFDEKDVGFSRFSKFVVEAAHRGLIALTKLDNGQYEIALGPEVSDAAAQPAGAPAPPAPTTAERPPRGESRSRGGRGGGRGARRGGGGGAFDGAVSLIKQALGRLGGEEHPVSAEELRETVNSLQQGEREPLEPAQLQQLLRKAHDREIVDLSKEEDGGYKVKLRGEPVAAPASAPPPPALAPVSEEEDEPPQPESSAPPPPYSNATSGAAPAIPSRSARFRRGSKGPRVASPAPGVPKIGVVEVDPNFRPRIEMIPAKPPVTEVLGGGDRAGRTQEGEREPREGRGRGRGRRGGRGRSRDGSDRGGERPESSERGGRGEHGDRGGRGGWESRRSWSERESAGASRRRGVREGAATRGSRAAGATGWPDASAARRHTEGRGAGRRIVLVQSETRAHRRDVTGRGRPLAATFYARPTAEVARRLLGQVLVSDVRGRHTAGRIVETEAYVGPHDPACHAWGGRRTPRCEWLYGPPGTAYIYFTYGMHWCLNAVTEAPGFPAAVLIRALEPLAGLATMWRRRGGVPDGQLCSGPARLCEALGITGALNGVSLARGGGPVRIVSDGRRLSTRSRVAVTARIGVTRAADWPLRFLLEDSPWASR